MHACSVCYGKAADLVVKYKIIIEAVGDYSSRDGMSIVHTIQSIITVTRARPSKHKLHVGVAMRDYIQYNRTTSKYTHMYWHCPYQALYQPHYAVCLLLQIIVCMHALMLLYYYYSLLLYILYMIVQLACVYVPVMLVSQSLCLTALINALLLSFFRDTCIVHAFSVLYMQ